MTVASREATFRDPKTEIFERPFRIAVVGGGPKGMYSLERLLHWFSHQSIHRPIEILVFEPAAAPGAGRVYDPRQPHHLRMNFAAKHIDAWVAGADRPAGCLNLMDWLERNYPHFAVADGYPPRAVVGEYLHDCFQTVTAKLGRIARVRTITNTVDRVHLLESNQWQVTAASLDFLVDELLMTIGHEGWRSSTKNASVPSPHRIEHVFPVTDQLSINRIPRDTTVRIRGFGLSWIDAVLTVTEGRGGKFIRDRDRWRYIRGGNEPRVILPFSRSGRPMLAKPVESATSMPNGVYEMWERREREIRELHPPKQGLDFVTTIWPTVVAAANELLCMCESNSHPMDVSDWFRRWRQTTGDAAFAVDAMRTSYEVANGWRPPDEAWALGHVWRKLYEAIVDRVSHGGLASESWEDFRPIGVEMERIAFGPPAENVGRILALVENGIVDFGLLGKPAPDASSDHESTCNPGDSTYTDRLVNAVLPAATEFADDGPLPNLLRAGIVKRMPGAGGIEVDRAGRPFDADGRRVQGLAIIGRPTEGCVLGNDSLSRKLHGHPDRWARSVIEHYLALQPRFA